MDKKDIIITISFMARWWEKHFYSKHQKPVVASDEEFERVHLQRLRFLFENFGEFGIGEEHPEKDGTYVNSIMKWCLDWIPFLLGVKLTCIEEGFWHPEPLTEDEIKELKPVDLADEPFGQWILARKETLEKRYGKAEFGQLIEGSINSAYRIRGEEIYTDLAVNKDMVKHLLEVITETVIMNYKFLAGEFDLEEVFLANCTNNHIGPELYEEMALQNDIRIAKETAPLFNKERFIYLHNCDYKADKFIDLYKNIPNLLRLDGSDTTDIERMKKAMPGVNFSTFLNPRLMKLPPAKLKQRFDSAVVRGSDEFLIANLDPSADIGTIRTLLKIIHESCNELDCNPVVSVVPFCEDEHEWAFPEYQGNEPYHCKDDWHRLVPKP